MGLSYILMLIAFYVDNGKQLPLWKNLPHFMYCSRRNTAHRSRPSIAAFAASAYKGFDLMP
jgi:hypothetical protein